MAVGYIVGAVLVLLAPIIILYILGRCRDWRKWNWYRSEVAIGEERNSTQLITRRVDQWLRTEAQDKNDDLTSKHKVSGVAGSTRNVDTSSMQGQPAFMLHWPSSQFSVSAIDELQEPRNNVSLQIGDPAFLTSSRTKNDSDTPLPNSSLIKSPTFADELPETDYLRSNSQTLRNTDHLELGQQNPTSFVELELTHPLRGFDSTLHGLSCSRLKSYPLEDTKKANVDGSSSAGDLRADLTAQIRFHGSWWKATDPAKRSDHLANDHKEKKAKTLGIIPLQNGPTSCVQNADSILSKTAKSGHRSGPANYSKSMRTIEKMPGKIPSVRERGFLDEMHRKLSWLQYELASGETRSIFFRGAAMPVHALHASQVGQTKSQRREQKQNASTSVDAWRFDVNKSRMTVAGRKKGVLLRKDSRPFASSSDSELSLLHDMV